MHYPLVPIWGFYCFLKVNENLWGGEGLNFVLWVGLFVPAFVIVCIFIRQMLFILNFVALMCGNIAFKNIALWTLCDNNFVFLSDHWFIISGYFIYNLMIQSELNIIFIYLFMFKCLRYFFIFCVFLVLYIKLFVCML